MKDLLFTLADLIKLSRFRYTPNVVCCNDDNTILKGTSYDGDKIIWHTRECAICGKGVGL